MLSRSDLYESIMTRGTRRAVCHQARGEQHLKGHLGRRDGANEWRQNDGISSISSGELRKAGTAE